MLPRTRHLPAAGQDVAQWCSVSYVDAALTRSEILRTSGASDEYHDWYERHSTDNGRTWSEPSLLPDVVERLPGGGLVTYPGGCHHDLTRGVAYEKRMRRAWPGLEPYTYDWGQPQHRFNDHCFIVEDGRERLLRFEDGPDYDPDDPFAEAFTRTNRAYVGVGMAFAGDGTAYHPVICQPGERSHSTGGVVLMRRDPASGDWLPSNLQFIAPELSSRGLLEPDVAVLRNGNLLLVMRGSSTPTTPGRKWMCVSTDGGRALSPVAELRYDDGTRFYSPSSIHTFVRSTRNGRLYWVANIVDQPPDGNGPRFPLCLAEIDEEKVAVRRDSVTVVDDRAEGEPEVLQLSNFSVVEDRETRRIEIYLTRIGEVADHFWQGAVYRYDFEPPV